ncbi:MAG: CRISPR-associated helicase Cas3' [Phycisphaerae bacterium]|nr:CRISPR-associated helicase Cas3' [Phycisphaerae bacterium]
MNRWSAHSGQSVPSALHILWAKSDPKNDQTFHPLLCHLIDTAAVAGQLWTKVLREPCRHRVAAALGLTDQRAQLWTAFWAGSHDLGKACPVFQAMRPQAARSLQEIGFDFPVGSKARHGQVSCRVLQDLLCDPQIAPPVTSALARRLATTVGGHHGLFPQTIDVDRLASSTLGNSAWMAVRRQVLRLLAQAVGVVELPAANDPPENDHASLMFLAGLTAVADWIASNTDFFPAVGETWDPVSYPDQAADRAKDALETLGWVGWQPEASEPLSFAELFPRIAEPRPLQDLAAAQAATLDGPGLVLIEAPMGEGKTEAALFLADHWTHAAEQKGLYVALPTLATSNQMFQRVQTFLSGRYPSERINLHLLHGHAMLSDRYEAMRLAALYDDEPGAVAAAVVAESWFAQNKKQALLAPFGVGTIDQVLLAVLQTKHVFVRLFGLAGKTVILDEVHAYDTYMSTILERLLEWLAALGCSVILLSATLPATRRRRLLETFVGNPLNVTEAQYPRMTIVRDGAVQSLPIAIAEDRRMELNLEWTKGDDLPERLRIALADGGCAAVIHNTVNAAQETYLRLQKALGDCGIEVELFHARFPFGRRDQIEERVLHRYGKPGEASRPRAAVLVATQVIEQSLDLDFDLMVSDLAPVDLVLQRAGRLHRHRRTRPERLIRPRLWLLRPDENKDGIPDFGPSKYVYAQYILLRSQLALLDRSSIRLPDDLEPLVEAVYNPDSAVDVPPSWQEALQESLAAMRQQDRDHRHQADCLVLRSPTCEDDILQDFCGQLEEDNPETHHSLQAATRLTEPSVTLICLYQVLDQVCLDFEGNEPTDLDQPPSLPQAKRLLQNAVTLTHPACVKHFVAQSPPPAWQKSALLRFHRPVLLDAAGTACFGNYRLVVHSDLGVMIEKTHCGKDADELQPDR